YWADEVLTAQISDWQNYVLEHDYFEERNRAWKFYVEAEQCIPTGSPASAELFYLAVVLGFVGDMEGAYRHELGQDLPGGRSDPTEARRHWAAQLQRQIQNESAGSLQGEPLEGDAEPVSGEATYKAGVAVFAISMLIFVIAGGWLVFGTRDLP
ncbi:MAG: DotU family type IV/VI secretion system protein, partial [Planctomycetaceae bacterium]|nr:DotU family type IV/VI secretion system protein [Planctomycetaceae bacterium]